MSVVTVDFYIKDSLFIEEERNKDNKQHRILMRINQAYSLYILLQACSKF
jgi:hypothetical protein